MKRLVTFLTAVVLMVMPATASAHSVRATNPLALAYSHAVSYIGSAPCGGHVKVQVAAEPPSIREEEKLDYGSTAPILSWATVPGVPCVVTFNKATWFDWEAIDTQWELACVAMIHELGNLDGLPETNEPYSTTNVRDDLLEEIVAPSACTHYSLIWPDGTHETRPWKKLPPGLHVTVN